MPKTNALNYILEWVGREGDWGRWGFVPYVTWQYVIFSGALLRALRALQRRDRLLLVLFRRWHNVPFTLFERAQNGRFQFPIRAFEIVIDDDEIVRACPGVC